MKINPTYAVANKTLTTCWIPNASFWNGVGVAVPLAGMTGSFKLGAEFFAAWWVLIFIATFKDPKYTKLLWRAWRRKPWLCPWRVAKGDRKRIQHV